MRIIILLTICALLSGCTHKLLAKNCEQTETGEYWVCDNVFWK